MCNFDFSKNHGDLTMPVGHVIPYQVGQVVEELIISGCKLPYTFAFGTEAKEIIVQNSKNINFPTYAEVADPQILEDRIDVGIRNFVDLLNLKDVEGLVLFGSYLWKKTPGDCDLLILTRMDTSGVKDYMHPSMSRTEQSVSETFKQMQVIDPKLQRVVLNEQDCNVDVKVFSEFAKYGYAAGICQSGPYLVVTKDDNGINLFGSIAGTAALKTHSGM